MSARVMTEPTSDAEYTTAGYSYLSKNWNSFLYLVGNPYMSC